MGFGIGSHKCRSVRFVSRFVQASELRDFLNKSARISNSSFLFDLTRHVKEKKPFCWLSQFEKFHLWMYGSRVQRCDLPRCI